MSINYVRFQRGSLAAYQALTNPDKDTLYFIYDKEGSSVGSLYMGDKLISGGDTNFTSASLDELADVIVAGAETHSFLIKDGDNWVAKTPNEVALLIQEYIDLPSNLIGDNLSVEINEDVIQLKNFGKGYYKYIPAVKDEVTGEITVDASYEYIEDDFVEGLEPRVTLNDKGILELAWYEPSKEDIDNINTEIESIVDNLESVSNDLKEVSDNIESVANDLKEVSDDVSLLDESVNGENGLKSQIEELANEIGAPADDAGNEATGLYAEIERIDEELVTKADADAVYTKEETNTAIETAIGAAIADADHLKREIVDALPDVEKADANTIYMVPSGLLEDDNKYYEWILINNVFEQVGSWEVDLKDYAKAADLEDLAEVVKEKADKGTTLADYGITDAYTKAEVYTKGEADQAIADKISEVNGGESAGEVLAQLNAYKKTLNMEVWGNETASGDSRVDLLENKVNGLEGAEPNFISSVDQANFVVVDGQLQLNTTNGRLITNDEISTLQEVANGDFDNFIDSVDETVFTVTDGKLELTALPTALLIPVIGDMTKLKDYSEGTTVVDELNNIYDILTWKDMEETV